MSDETFLPLKTQRPEQNQLRGISLPGWLSMHQGSPDGVVILFEKSTAVSSKMFSSGIFLLPFTLGKIHLASYCNF